MILGCVKPFSSEVLVGVTVAVPTRFVGPGVGRVAKYRDAVRILKGKLRSTGRLGKRKRREKQGDNEGPTCGETEA